MTSLLSPDVIQKVKTEIIEPSVIKDVRDISNSKFMWRKAGNYLEGIGKILTGASTILAFSAGVFSEHTILGFTAGCVGTIALVCIQGASYSFRESTERNSQLNMILDNMGVERVPEITQVSLREDNV